MDHGRKEAMETRWPPVGGASQRPAIITQGLRRSSSLSPVLPGSGCLLSLPGSPVLCPLPTPTPGFPALAFGATLLALCFLASVHFSHQLCLCVSYCRVAKTRCPHHANTTSAEVCGQVLVKKLKFSKTVLCLFPWGGGCVWGGSVSSKGSANQEKLLQSVDTHSPSLRGFLEVPPIFSSSLVHIWL